MPTQTGLVIALVTLFVKSHRLVSQCNRPCAVNTVVMVITCNDFSCRLFGSLFFGAAKHITGEYVITSIDWSSLIDRLVHVPDFHTPRA